jgi:hypothetical protein
MTDKTCTVCKGKKGMTAFDDVCGGMVFDLCEACGGSGVDQMTPTELLAIEFRDLGARNLLLTRAVERLGESLAAEQVVQGWVLCEDHNVARAEHCNFHGNYLGDQPCYDLDCDPCAGPFQDLIARPRTGNTP